MKVSLNYGYGTLPSPWPLKFLAVFFAFSLCGFARGDAFDPTDDTSGSATLLIAPTPTVQSHGPHTVGNPDTADWFAVDLKKGGTYIFDTIGGSGDTAVELYDPTGTQLLASDDDSGGNLMFQLTYVPYSYGRFLLKVESFAGGPSSYNLNYHSYDAPDQWDPGDDQQIGATLIPEPNFTPQFHGPHFIGAPGFPDPLLDSVDYFKVHLKGFATYRFAMPYAGFGSNGTTFMAVFDENFNVVGTMNGVNYDAVPPLTGDYYLIAEINSAKHNYNLQYEQTSDVGDLKLDSVSFGPASPSPVKFNDPIQSHWTVSGSNTLAYDAGRVEDANLFYFELFASKSGGFDLERFGGTITNSFLRHHAAGTQQYDITPTSGQTLNAIPDGLYTAVGYINRPGTHRLEETTISNNIYPVPGQRLYVHNPATPMSDLAWANTPTWTVQDGSVEVLGKWTDIGTQGSPYYGFWIETLYGTLSPEGSFDVAGYAGPGVKRNSVPGTVFVYDNGATVPSGRWAFAALLDSTDLDLEINDSNNFAIYGTPPATSGTLDLEILSAAVSPSQLAPTELPSTATLNWTCKVRNNSNEDSGPVWVELFPSRRGGLDTLRSGTTLTGSDKFSFPANSVTTISLSQSLNRITDGIYNMVAYVNRQGTGGPGESNALNNRFILPGRILLHNSASSHVNLKWSDGPHFAVGGTTITLTGTVVNNGTAASGPFWTEMFYGIMDYEGIFNNYGSIVFGQHTATLAPSDTVNISLTGQLPPGSWNIGALCDSTDIVAETDETDNYDYFVP